MMPTKPPTAAVIAKRERVAAQLETLHPLVFSRSRPFPLVEGVHREIARHLIGVSLGDIRRFLGWWTRRHAYLNALQERGARRYHVDGGKGPRVSPEHQRLAREFQEHRLRLAAKRRNASEGVPRSAPE